eukprot:11159672-Lingulodinium_polyedra.AAC.1
MRFVCAPQSWAGEEIAVARAAPRGRRPRHRDGVMFAAACAAAWFFGFWSGVCQPRRGAGRWGCRPARCVGPGADRVGSAS